MIQSSQYGHDIFIASGTPDVNMCAFYNNVYTGSPFIINLLLNSTQSNHICYSMGIIAHTNGEINYFQDVKLFYRNTGIRCTKILDKSKCMHFSMHCVSVCLLPIKLTATYLICESKLWCHKVYYGISNVCIVQNPLKTFLSSVSVSFFNGKLLHFFTITCEQRLYIYHQIVYVCMCMMYVGGGVPGLVCTALRNSQHYCTRAS